MATVVVYGATGPQGRPVATRLLAAGHTVRCVVRNPSSAPAVALRNAGAAVFAGDFLDIPSLRAASRGADGVFLLVPFMDPRAVYGRNALDAARAEGVRRVVWNPTGNILPVKTGNPGMDVRLEVLEHLQASGLEHVVVEPTAYMENFLMPALVEELRARNTFAYPMPPASRVQWICHDDVAQFVVKAFASPHLVRERVAVSGPEALTGSEIAVRLSRALGRPIGFRPMPPAEFGRVLDGAMGPGTGARVVGFYEQLFANPSMMDTQVDLPAALTKLPIQPTSVEQWASAHRTVLG